MDSTVQHLSTEAKIIVHSQPAVITLRGLDDPMFTSGQSIEIGWTVENFDLATNPEECQFQFTVEKDGAAIYTNYCFRKLYPDTGYARSVEGLLYHHRQGQKRR